MKEHEPARSFAYYRRLGALEEEVYRLREENARLRELVQQAAPFAWLARNRAGWTGEKAAAGTWLDRAHEVLGDEA